MKLFLSHASGAKPLVRALTAGLPPHVQVWLDQDELTAGAPLAQRLERVIEAECDYVLVFVDEDALASDWVKREVAIALQREEELQREFLLPVMLAPLEARMAELGVTEELIYLDATDHSPEGLARSAALLEAQLFALASRLIEGLRSLGRRQMLRHFEADLNDYKQAAFMWLATLRNSLAVLSSNPDAFDHVRQALVAYNSVSDRVIPGLGAHRDRICDAWQQYKGLSRQFRDLTADVDNEIYRGAMFRLNEVLGLIHQLDAGRRDGLAPTTAQDARKDQLVNEADAALTAMADRSTELVAQLEQEI
ncbi:MAG: hypothetical protein RJA98_3615 [Pseudomonadota bacterium]|jgi:hypothetical protein